jgi:WD40 repeat protein
MAGTPPDQAPTPDTAQTTPSADGAGSPSHEVEAQDSIVLVPQTGHVTQIWAVAESPDGKLIATGGFDHTIRIWLQSGEVLAVLPGHQEAVTSVAFSPDGRMLASAARDQSVRLWDLDRGGRGRKLPTSAMTVSWHRSGKILLTAGYQKEVKLWDVAKGQLAAERAIAKRQLLAGAFSPNGQHIVTRGLDGEVTILKTTGLEPVGEARVPAGYSRSISFSPDSKRVALGSGQGIHLLEVADGSLVAVAKKPGLTPYRAVFSPDGATLASVGGGSWVHLWDGATGQYLRGFAQADGVEALAWSRDGERIITGGDDPLARIFDVQSGKLIRKLGNGAGRAAATMSPDGSRIAMLGPRRVEVLDVQTARVLGHFRVRTDPYTGPPTWSPKGRYLVTGHERGVEVWDGLSYQRLGSIRIPNPEKHTFDVAFSPDEATLAIGVYQDLRLWDVATRQVAHAHKLTSFLIGGLAFSPDGKELGVGTRQGVMLVDPATAQPTTLLDVKKGVAWGALVGWAWSLDGQHIVACTSQQAQLWEVSTRQLQGKIKSANNFVDPVFGPAGMVLSAGQQRLLLWDGNQARTVASGHERSLRSFAFSPAWLASGGDDGRVHFYDHQGRRQRLADTQHAGRVWQLAWHPAGEVLMSVSHDVFLHRATDGVTVQLRTLDTAGGPVGLAHTKGGLFLAEPRAYGFLRFRQGDDLTRAALIRGDQGGAEVARPDLLRTFWAGEPLR